MFAGARRDAGWRIRILVGLGAVAAAALAWGSQPASASAAAGQLDRSFGQRGVLSTGMGIRPGLHSSSIAGLTVQGDGRIVFGTHGSSGAMVVQRLLPNGSYDPAFGGDGRVVTPIQGLGLAVGADGSIVVVGSIGDGAPRQDLAVMRYLPNGRADSSFGRGGAVRLDLGLKEVAGDVVVQPSGRIVFAGTSYCSEREPGCRWNPRSVGILVRLSPQGKVISTRRFPQSQGMGLTGNDRGELALLVDPWVRGRDPEIESLNQDGTPRRQFGDDGAVPTPNRSDYGSFLLQDDGKIVLAGFRLSGGGLRRLDATGSADAGFGAGGEVSCAATGAQSVSEPSADVAAFDDGRLLASGGQTDCGLVRYLPDGRPDPAFGQDGRVDPRALLGGSPQLVAAGPGGTALVARWEAGTGFRFARYLGNGSPDPSFGSGGSAVVPGLGSTLSHANAILALPHGKLLAVGTAACADRSCGLFALARYERSGKLDRRFGQGGRTVTYPDGVGRALAAAVQPDGRIVVVGGSGAREYGEIKRERLAAARYLPNGRLDTGFGDGGLVTLPSGPGENVRANAVAIAPDGDIVIAGGASCEDSEECGESYCSECGDFVIARLRADGVPERRFGRSGVVRIDVGKSREDHDTARSVAIDRRGRIVVAGRSYLGGVGLVRLLPDGRRDGSFGRRGIVLTEFTITLRNDAGEPFEISVNRPGNSLALLRNGRILVGGGYDHHGRRGRFNRNHGAVVRYLGNGKIDRSFGDQGSIETGHLAVSALAVDRCGRIVLAGGFNPKKGVDRFGVTRRLSSGAPDPSFGKRVRGTAPGNGGTSYANGVAVSGSRIVLAGVAGNEIGGEDLTLAAFRGGRCSR